MQIEQKKFFNRKWFIVLNLVLIIICIGSLLLLIIIYPKVFGTNPTVAGSNPSESRPTLQATSTPEPTFSPTYTKTLFPTLSPTITHTPTRTPIPTLTPTPLGPPTLTPARALPLSGEYDLVHWSPEKAANMVKLMNDYPNTLSETQRGEDNRSYYQAFKYAIIAQREGLLRFPDAPQAAEWDWGLAYNLARLGDPAAGSQYADLIVSALNQGEPELPYLYTWFQQREPRMRLYMIELEALSGYLGNYLLEIRGNGSSFIWLLQSSSGFRAYPLLTLFDFINKPHADWIVADLNGNPQDGQEIAIYFSNTSDEYQVNPPSVYNLSQIPPKELPFLPAQNLFNIGMQFKNNWVVSPNSSSGNDLLFESDVFPACPVTIRLQYHWKDNFFGLVSKEYQINQDIKTLNYCQLIVDHVANVWGPEAAISVMTPLIEDWPPEKDIEGQSFALDAKDEWRFRLGIYSALTGEAETAKQYLMGLVSNPTVFTSSWVRPAREFLETYQQPQDLYRACLQAEECNPSIAIQTLVEQISPSQDVLDELRSYGVSTSSSGFFDFDDDEEAERWFTARYRSRSKLNFWILAAYSLGYQALFVGQVDSTSPSLDVLEDIYIQEQALGFQPAILFDNKKALSLQRIPDSQEPYLVEIALRKEYPNRFLAGLFEAQDSLLSGVSPSKVQDELSNLAYYPGLLCKGTWSCDPYFYLLGLASELAGDSRAAVEAYHRLWLDYSLSPYTTMARLKLSGGVFISPTPTASQTLQAPTEFTPTDTEIPSPTATGTPPTATASPEKTFTATNTSLATTEPYPVPATTSAPYP